MVVIVVVDVVLVVVVVDEDVMVVVGRVCDNWDLKEVLNSVFLHYCFSVKRA